MSTTADGGDDAIVVDDGPDPDSLRGRFRSPEVRNYLFSGLAALAMVFVVLFGRGSDLGGLLILVAGAGGVVFRKAGMPVFVLLLVVYFLVFPDGIPYLDQKDPLAIRDGSFDVGDVILAAAVLGYAACHYRVYALAERAVPQDTLYPARGAGRPPRRPPANIRPGELTRVAALAVAAAVGGQLVWWGLTAATIDVLGTVPVRFDRPQAGGQGGPPAYAASLTRVLLVVGLAAAATLLGRLVFGYGRLRRLSPEEGRMVLLEAGWNETRREDVRLAAWRLWRREKGDGKGQPERGPR